jgi:hypothetical protein
VLTTLIILVASVVLGTGVVVFGSSLFQTGSQQEAIAIQGVKMWVNATDSNGVAWGAAAVRNSGDKFLSVDTIQVRGASVPYTSWYVDSDPTRVTVENFQSQFNHTTTTAAGLMKDSEDSGYTVTSQCASDTSNDATTLEVDLDGSAGTKPTLCLLQASGPAALQPGDRLVVYFRVPNGVFSPVDSGSSSNVNIFAGRTGSPTSVTVSNP